MIIVERRTFTRVFSVVCNGVVDEGAHKMTHQRREFEPNITGILSDAASVLARSQVSEAHIDQTVLDLTGSNSRLSTGEHAVTAIADRVAYRVRCDIMDELLEATVYELSPFTAVLGANISKTAVVVQSAVRRKATFREARSLVTRTFIKMYDPQYGSFYWYNEGTGQSPWEMPTVIDAFLKRKLA